MNHTSRYSKIKKPLTTNIHFYTAQMDHTPIIIFIGTELIGSGMVENVTETSIKINGEYYIKEVCTFKYDV